MKTVDSNETLVVVETTDNSGSATVKPEKKSHTKCDKETFVAACFTVANSDDKTIDHLCRLTGQAKSTVQGKRVELKKEFKAAGLEFPELPRGSNGSDEESVTDILSRLGLPMTPVEPEGEEKPEGEAVAEAPKED